MGKTVLFVPRKEMIEPAKALLSEFPGAVDDVRCPASTATAVYEAKASIADGADIIIARGLQAAFIEENCKVPVVSMRITAQEVALLVDKAKHLCKVPHPKIALVAAANLLPDLSAFNMLFDIDLRIYLYNTAAPLGSAAEEAFKAKPDVVIGGIVDVEESLKLGIPALYAASTEESMREAIRASMQIRNAIELRKKIDAHYESLFTGAFNGFILFDNNGIAQRCNPAAELLLGSTEKEIMAKSVSALFPKLDMKRFNETVETGTVTTEFVSIKWQNFVIVLKPVVTDRATDGVVLSFRRVGKGFDRWETSQSRLRTSFLVPTESPAMKRCIQTAKLFCLTALPILIHAEPGVDALYIARCIHANSDCTKDGPFITADCGCWYGCEQQNDYLFGYGPKSNREFALGILGLAREGTLFLDNIEALCPSVQARLYHAVCYHTLVYPESAAPVPISFRLVARTSLSACQLTNGGNIIPELYHILAPMSFEIPPLRETPEDIPRLAGRHFNHYCNKYERLLKLTPEAIDQLKTYSWDGNLPQFKVFMERLVITAEEQEVGRDQVKTLMQHIYPVSKAPGQAELRANYSKEEMRIIDALRRFNGDREATAEELGISKTTLWRWMKKYAITTKF